jgi:hypothetical protein
MRHARGSWVKLGAVSAARPAAGAGLRSRRGGRRNIRYVEFAAPPGPAPDADAGCPPSPRVSRRAAHAYLPSTGRDRTLCGKDCGVSRIVVELRRTAPDWMVEPATSGAYSSRSSSFGKAPTRRRPNKTLQPPNRAARLLRVCNSLLARFAAER